MYSLATNNLYVNWAYVNYCDDSTIYGGYDPGTC